MNALNNANIKDDDAAGLASCAFPEVKNTHSGVSVRYVRDEHCRWYVLRIKYGKTQVVADELISDGHYCYFAKVWKVVKNPMTGKKRKILTPFLNLLFAYLTDREAACYVNEGIYARWTTYYYNHFVDNGGGTNPPLTVSEADMIPFIRVTSLQDTHVMQVDLRKCRFRSDDVVEVTDGPFKGVRGRVARIARQDRVVVCINGLNSGLTTAYIPNYSLRKVDEKQ